jgi:hypothetical protein
MVPHLSAAFGLSAVGDLECVYVVVSSLLFRGCGSGLWIAH